MSEPEAPATRPTLVDSHCHLSHDYAPKTADDLIREAKDAGVEWLVNIATDRASLAAVQELSERYPRVPHTAGIHPHEVGGMTDADLAAIREAARNPRCRAIGEIGLDYHYDHSPRDAQRRWLAAQLDLAVAVGLPAVIHSREAEADLLVELDRYSRALPPGRLPGVIHCFSGTRELADACVRLGFHVSFSGILTFKNAEAIRRAAAALPLDRVLVETDAPYLAPVPYRGKRCEPAMVRLTAARLAEIRDVTVDEIARRTTENARALFGLG